MKEYKELTQKEKAKEFDNFFEEIYKLKQEVENTKESEVKSYIG